MISGSYSTCALLYRLTLVWLTATYVFIRTTTVYRSLQRNSNIPLVSSTVLYSTANLPLEVINFPKRSVHAFLYTNTKLSTILYSHFSAVNCNQAQLRNCSVIPCWHNFETVPSFNILCCTSTSIHVLQYTVLSRKTYSVRRFRLCLRLTKRSTT
jgi:hypothetical protein